jgi:hypothetical protein
MFACTGRCFFAKRSGTEHRPGGLQTEPVSGCRLLAGREFAPVTRDRNFILAGSTLHLKRSV